MATRKTKAKTKKHHFHVTHIPVSSWIVFWLGIAATFVLIFVTFGAAFQAFVLDGSDLTSQALQRINQNLEKQLADLQTQPSGRVLANRDVIVADPAYEAQGDENISVTCGRLQLNYTTETQSFSWRDEKTGVLASLPYSFSWGNEKYALTPYEEGVQMDGKPITGTSFGPLVKAGDCIPLRDSSLSISPSMDANMFIRDLKKQGFEQDLSAIRQRTLGGITVLSYRIDAMGGGNYWEVFGRSYHYTINSLGWLTDAEAIKIIQSLRVTK